MIAPPAGPNAAGSYACDPPQACSVATTPNGSQPVADLFYRGAAADEGILIARLAFDGAFARRYAGVITDDLFRDPTWRRVHREVQNKLRSGDAADPDPTEISRAIRSGFSPDEAHERCTDFADWMAFSEASARGALRRLVDRQQCDLMSAAAARVRDELGTPAMNLGEAKAVLLETMADIGIGSKLETMADALATDPADDDHELIRTGVGWFDEKMPDGALRLGDVMAVAGPPGVGKTALVLQVAVSAVTTDPAIRVLWAAGEMTQKALRNRALSCLASLPVSILRLPQNELSPLQVQAKQDAINVLREAGDRFTFVMAPLTPQAVEAGILATGSRLVVIDYLQLMRPETTGRSRREDIDNILRELVRMAQSHGVAMILISDMSKGSLRGRTVFDAFKESSEIPYCADLCYVAELVGVDDDADMDDLPDEVRVRWRCLKSRHGSPRSISTHFQRFHQQFREDV